MKRTLIISVAALATALAAWGAGAVEVEQPAAGATLQPGTVVHVEWRNSTTLPATVYILYENQRKALAVDDLASRGTALWRVPADEGTYTLVVEATNGAKAKVDVTVGEATAPATAPQIYALPNPYNLSTATGPTVFAGAPAGSKATIYDMEGRKVADAAGDPLGWDGHNERGDVVAGGTYMFVLETPTGGRFTGKIAVVK